MRQLPPPVARTASRGHILTVASTVCAAVMALSSCADNYIETPNLKEYEQNFVKQFGVPAENHSWSMARGHIAHVNLPSEYNGTVRLFTSVPGSENCNLLANIQVKDGKADEPFFVPGGLDKAFALISDDPDVYTYAGFIPLKSVEIYIDDSDKGSRAAVNELERKIKFYYNERDLYIKPDETHAPTDEGYVRDFVDKDWDATDPALGTAGVMTQRELWDVVQHISNTTTQPEVFPWGEGKKYSYSPERFCFRSDETMSFEVCTSTLHEHYSNVKIGYFCYEDIAEFVYSDYNNDVTYNQYFNSIIYPGSVYGFFYGTYKVIAYDGTAEGVWNCVSYNQDALNTLKEQFDANYDANYTDNPRPDQTKYASTDEYNKALQAYEDQYRKDWAKYKKDKEGTLSASTSNVSYSTSGETNPSLQAVSEMTQEQADASENTYNTVTINVPGNGKRYGLFIVGENGTGDNKEVELITTDPYFNSLLHKESGDFYRKTTEAAVVNNDDLEYTYVGFGMEAGHHNVGPLSGSSDASGRDALDLVLRIPKRGKNGSEVSTESMPDPVRPNMEPKELEWIIAFEDLGGTDDFDFNDVVLSYKYNSGNPTFKLLAAGGTLDTKIYINYYEWGEVHELFGAPKGTMINTGLYTETNYPEKTLTMGSGDPDLDHYVELDLIFERIENEQQAGFKLIYYYMPQIQLYTIREDKDDYGDETLIYDSKWLSPENKSYNHIAPTALILTGNWRWPKERCNILDAYPNFSSWVGDHTKMNEGYDNITGYFDYMQTWIYNYVEDNVCPSVRY